MTVASTLLYSTTALVATLSQTRTNGNSKWGTFQAPKWPGFLTNNPVVNGYPWGTKSPSNADPYFEAPNTGVVRSYDFTIARGVVAPDGYSKSLYLVNGQYPGVSALQTIVYFAAADQSLASHRSQLGRHYPSHSQ